MLSDPELRVLGCLVEKQMTTPEYYPLTLNAVAAACNQRSNRRPVVDYDDETISAALDGLRERGMCRAVHRPGQRAPKYRHTLDEVLSIDREQSALLAVLMLRGPQTVGELRTRSDRYLDFASLAEVADVLAGLASRDQPLVERLERRPGEKEPRYRHLLGGTDRADGGGAEPVNLAAGEPAALPRKGRLDAVEAEVAELRAALESLQQRVDALVRSLGGDEGDTPQ